MDRDVDAGMAPRWQKSYWRRMLPLLGPEYGRLAWHSRGRAIFGYLALWASIFLVITWMWTLGQNADWITTTVVSVIVGGIGAGSLSFSMAKFYKVGSRIARDLRERGFPVKGAADLRSAGVFLRWCARENITPAQVIETGRLKYGTPTGEHPGSRSAEHP